MDALSITTYENAWQVFLLFAVPVGGGIPAGALLAQKSGMGWVEMSFLYFVSDVALALVFEPVMKLIVFASLHVPLLARIRSSLRRSTDRTIARYGTQPGPFLLVMIAFGVDPMTGRAAALARGHGFVAGWAIAIAGDMLFFTLIVISTLLLDRVLGDGTWTAIIVMCAMFIIPPLIRKIRGRGSEQLL